MILVLYRFWRWSVFHQPMEVRSHSGWAMALPEDSGTCRCIRNSELHYIVLLCTCSRLISAYKNPGSEAFVTVLINLSETESKVDMGAEGEGATYTTDKDRNMGFSMHSLNEISLPARSVVTVIR